MRSTSSIAASICPLVISFALLPAIGAAQARPAPEQDSQLTASIESIVTKQLAKQPLPGLSIAVVRDGRVVYKNGWGWADLENNVPATAETVYRAASVTKPITATAAMILAAEGHLNLDAPIQRYCPVYPIKQWPVTTRELLGHLAGVRHYKSDALTSPEVMSTTHYGSLNEAIGVFAADPLVQRPGTKFLYSTYGYVLVGCALEGASKKPYSDVLKDLVFVPAQMRESSSDDVFLIIPHRARAYSRDSNGQFENAPFTDLSDKTSAGGLLSSVEDLAAFAIALESNRLLNPTQRTIMWTPQRTSNGEQNGYALGWGTFMEHQHLVVGHSGNQPGGSAALDLIPDSNIAVAVMTNISDADVDDVAVAILDIMLKDPSAAIRP